MSSPPGKSPQRAANDLTTLLKAVLGEDRFPVDVEALAREMSGKQPDPITDIVGVDIPGFDGMLRANRKSPGWQILFNDQSGYPGRDRFTLAHEFGHYMLHRRPLTDLDYAGGALAASVDFQCLPLRSGSWKEAERVREGEADTFASYLLMPIDDYRDQTTGQTMSRSLLAHLTDRYGVSLQAALLKWIEFTATRSALVVARDGFALWGRASSSAARSGVFVRSGMPIPDGSIAGGAAPTNKDRPVDLPAGIWTFSRGSEPVKELTMFSENLGISVSLLQFDDAPGGADIEEDEPWDTFDQFASRDRS
jgi:hypothetical protein